MSTGSGSGAENGGGSMHDSDGTGGGRSGGTRGEGAIDAVLRCYPAWWRDRYADEMGQVVADLAAEGRSVPLLTVDLVRGAVRARVVAAGMPRVRELWAARTRISVVAATLPWLLVVPPVLFAIANQAFVMPKGMLPATVPASLLSVGHLQEMTANARTVATPPLSAAGTVAFDSARATALLLLISLLVLTCGWGGLRGAIRRSPAPHRRRLLLLAWAPALSLLVDVTLVTVQNRFQPIVNLSRGDGPTGALGGNPAALHALQHVLTVVPVGGWLVATACVGLAATRARVDVADLRFGRNTALAVSVLLCALLGSYLTWMAALSVQDHQAAHGSVTVLTGAHQWAWLPVAAVLACAVAVSALSASIARRSWRTLALLA